MTDAEIEKAVVGFTPLADWWASRIQWCEDDHKDLVQEGLKWLLITLRGYQKSGRPIRDLSSVANSCLSCGMKWMYKKKDREDREVLLGDATPAIVVEGHDEYFTEVYNREYILEVGRVLGKIAREIVENLITPGPAVIGVAMEEMALKAERHKNGEKVVGWDTLRISNDHIRKSVHLTEGEWQKEWTEIRKFTAEYLGIPLPKKNKGPRGRSEESLLSHVN